MSQKQTCPQLNIPLIVRRKDIPRVVGFSAMHADRLEAAGKFPKRVRFSNGVVGWYGPEVVDYVAKAVQEVRQNS